MNREAFKLLPTVFLIFLAGAESARAEMDRWEVLSMRDRYAQKNPETLGRPAPTAQVPDHEMSAQQQTAPPTPSAAVKRVIPPPPIQKKAKKTINSSASAAKIGSGKRLAPTVANLRLAAHQLAEKKLTYDFGSDEVDSGGLDCSSTVQYLLRERLGIKGVPRTSYNQYAWLEKKGTLHKLKGKKASHKLLRRLSPGDLIFWGKTWSSGHKVSHVMIYMGWNPKNGKHYVFGARGKRVKGLTGAGVDVFELKPDRGVLVGHGRVPGVRK